MLLDRPRRWLSGAIADESLARRLQEGDLDALSVLFERYHPRIDRFLLRLVGCPEDAEDLAQDVFLRVYASIHSYAPDRPFRPWLYTVAKRIAWKRLSDRRGTAAVSLEELPESGELLEDDAAEDPAAVVDRAAEAEAIRQAVESLSAEQRLVFILFYYESLPYDQIAEICDCPVGTVKSRMHYAVHQLRRRLAYLREDPR